MPGMTMDVVHEVLSSSSEDDSECDSVESEVSSDFSYKSDG